VPFQPFIIKFADGRDLSIHKPDWLWVNQQLRFVTIWENGVQFVQYPENYISGVIVLRWLSRLINWLSRLPERLKDIFIRYQYKQHKTPELLIEFDTTIDLKSAEEFKVDILARQRAIPFRPFVIRTKPEYWANGRTFSVIHPSCLWFTSEDSIGVQDPVRPSPRQFPLKAIAHIRP